jgi:hypothetical protein
MENKNPDFVKIICPHVVQLHGFGMGEVAPVIRREVNIPDDNGFEIYVHSPRFNRSIFLGTTEYEPIKQEQL